MATLQAFILWLTTTKTGFSCKGGMRAQRVHGSDRFPAVDEWHLREACFVTSAFGLRHWHAVIVAHFRCTFGALEV